MLIHDTQKSHLLRYIFIVLSLLLFFACSHASAKETTANSEPVNADQVPPGLAAARQESANGATEAQADEELERVLVSEPKPIQTFKLHDQNGNEFSANSLKGKWSFLVFGYTNCPDVCPTTLAEMDDFTALIPSGELKDNTQVLFVTLDPKRDTDKELKTYLGYFNSGFIGVSGSVEDLQRFCKLMDINFEYQQITKTIYGVSHSSSVVLLDPQARYVARFAVPIYAKELLKKYSKVVQYLHKS